MKWTYEQSTGRLLLNGQLVAQGYSGSGGGKNNPEVEHMADLGPIPRGMWQILPPRLKTSSRGPYVLPLKPVNHNARGRYGFLIHGDSRSHPGSASKGCIILPKDIRVRIWESGIHKLEVVK